MSKVELYKREREFEDLYQLAELLVDWDARVSLWRSHHYKVVERIIGANVVGTQGTPVDCPEARRIEPAAVTRLLPTATAHWRIAQHPPRVTNR